MKNSRSPLRARRLLLRLRSIMGSQGSAEARLRRIVTAIASTMGTEVCSCYLRRGGDVLELFATRGLNPEAVHQTRLRFDEGLVGQVAASGQPLALADAPSHRQFAFRPETAEEPFRSFLGVPLLSAGRPVGVLVIPSPSEREYRLEEIEVLQTTAMVLTEMVARAGFVAPVELAEAPGNVMLPRRIQGTGLARGTGIGQAVHHGPPAALDKMVATNPDQERQRLETAIGDLVQELDRMSANFGQGRRRAVGEVLDAFRLFVEESSWTRRMREQVASGLSAEAAVARVQEDTRVQMRHVTDAYLRERLADFDDLANRLRALLSNGDGVPRGLPDDVVVVARDLGPAALLEYGVERLRGLVLEGGSPTMHVTIVARGLGIPVVGNAREATLHLEEGAPVIVDGSSGEIFVDPPEDVLEMHRARLRAHSESTIFYERVRTLPARTLDGINVSLAINAALAADVDEIESSGAEAVGLYRTEVPFLLRKSFPDRAEQEALYREVLLRAGSRPVTFRTLDVGGDKRVGALASYRTGADNPALGWRGIRIAFDQPALLRTQLRALLAAHGERPMRVMFPMVADAMDLRYARQLLMRELRRTRDEGGAVPGRIEIGAMVEVPSLLWETDALFREVDFVAVGTNDFCQFLYACDRADRELERRYPFLATAALNALRMLVHAADSAGVEVSVCGEVAGRPLDALALVAIGVRALSMSPSSVGTVKAAIRSFDRAAGQTYLEGLCRSGAEDLRHRFRNFVRDHGIRA